MPFNIGLPEILIVLAIALIVLGPKRLPEVGASLGKSIREFRKAATEVQEATSLEPPAAPAQQAPAPTPQPNQLSQASQPNTIVGPEPAVATTPATTPAAPAASVGPSVSTEPDQPGA